MSRIHLGESVPLTVRQTGTGGKQERLVRLDQTKTSCPANHTRFGYTFRVRHRR